MGQFEVYDASGFVKREENMNVRPLDGLRVVDMTHVLAGPYCTYQLGLLGAEIIKVESLKGDMVRGWGGSEEQLAKKLGYGFAAQNAGKRSISLNAASKDGADIVRKLISTADVFIENYRPGSMAKLGLDYESVREQNPRLIYTSISAFGQDGPHGHRPGFDDVVQATSGFMSINVRDDGPIRTGGPVLDYATGMHSASAVLAACLLREKTGEGQRIDLAMQDVTMLLMNRNTMIAATSGEELEPASNREGPLLGRYKAKDGYVMLAGYLPHHCRTILNAIGLSQFSTLKTPELFSRILEVEAAVEAKLVERTAVEWDQVFADAGVVGGGVKSIEEVFATNQPESRQLFAEVESAAGTMQATTNGYKLNGTTFKPQSGIPLLGEHTREVLTELGYHDEDIQVLESASTIRTH